MQAMVFRLSPELAVGLMIISFVPSGLAKFFKLSKKQAISIGYEAGIQNGALALIISWHYHWQLVL